MSIAPYLKEIGRGQHGARALGRAQAQDLMARILDGEVSDLELGGFALAMRMKGETLDELDGFLEALLPRCLALPAAGPVVVVPSYNGARRLPNLTPLLAMRLAQEGLRVLVHGPRQDPTRVSSAEVFHALGLPPAEGVAAVHERWRRHEPAFLPTDVLCPPLQRLLDLRWVLGVRNAGHTLAKLLPVASGAPVLQLASHTHPEFGLLMAGLAERRGLNLQLLRGTEGEPVADPRRCPRIDTWLQGRPQPTLACPAQEGVLTALPILPRGIDPATVALYIQAVVAGAQPAPAPLERQVALLVAATRLMTAPEAAAAPGPTPQATAAGDRIIPAWAASMS